MADMHLSASEVKFLAARLRRLFQHFGYELPDLALDDADLIRITGTCIGDFLRRLGTPGVMASQPAQRCMHGNEGTCPHCKAMEDRLRERREQARSDYGKGRARLANVPLTGDSDAPDAA